MNHIGMNLFVIKQKFGESIMQFDGNNLVIEIMFFQFHLKALNDLWFYSIVDILVLKKNRVS